MTGMVDGGLPHVLGRPGSEPAGRAVFTALGTARSMRYLRPDPVGREYVEAIVWAATRAASADNCQPWEFIAVTDAGEIRELAAAVAPFREMVAGLPPPAGEVEARTIRGAHYLFDHLAEVPLLLFICGRSDVRVGMQPERYVLLAVAGAAQNAMVAARALGLGAAYTMFHLGDQAAVGRILGLPEHVRPGVLLALGWPARSHGPMIRKPVSEVLRYDHW
jgi:nitroreductase